MSESDDRQQILRRRLAFIASALSGLALGSVAKADPVLGEACAASPPPTPEDVEQADALFASSREAQRAGRPSEAANAAAAAHRLVPTTEHAAAAGTALLESDDAFAAFLLLAEHIRCRGDGEALAPVVAKLESLTGGVSLEVGGDSSWELTIDGRPVPRPLRSLVIRLPPGKHVISIVAPSYTPPAVTVDVAIDRIEKVRQSAVAPMPCLSPPPPRRNESVVELAVGAIAPIVAVDTRLPISVAGGGGARGAVAVQFTEGGWFNGDLFTVVTGPPTKVFALTSADIRYYLGMMGFGVGFSGGFAVAEKAEPLWGPTIIPIAIANEAFRLELRVPCWFDDDPARGALYVAPHVVVGVAAGPREVARSIRSRS